ncbi:GYF-like protein [Artemisia annua]|uniref:GYF-like protein n=1 Tax=Artemisia annua TaxID=35608 RepID=A0A2U1M090_ARTAN|nr:GYF-like protein [Artemisia annua]
MVKRNENDKEGEFTSTEVTYHSSTKVGSAENIADAEDFGSTTEKDGNINLVKEFVDPNGRTDQTDSENLLLLNGLKTNLTVVSCSRPRLQLRQVIADNEPELAAICSAVDERPVHIR